MATYQVSRCKHATLSTTTVDTVTLAGGGGSVEVMNRAAAGGVDLFFTNDGSTPVSNGDECFIVPAGSALRVPSSLVGSVEVVKVLGNANAYSVMAIAD